MYISVPYKIEIFRSFEKFHKVLSLMTVIKSIYYLQIHKKSENFHFQLSVFSVLQYH